MIARLIDAGAQGYCLKGIPAEKLILALRSIASGASWWDQTATSMIQSQFQRSISTNPATSGNPLTKREQEILKLIALGKSNPEIADVLYITPGTVRVHVHAILHKLNVRDRTQAVVLALQNQYLESEKCE